MRLAVLPAIAACVLAASARAAVTPAPTDPLVQLKTNKGDILVRVYKRDAPITANNFLDLVQRGFYKNLTWHRVVKGHVIQTGDPTATGGGGFVDPKTGKERTIPLETNPRLKHDAAGVLGMARSNDPNSASSQFYITLDAKPFLDGGYAVFGRVEKGMDVVHHIEKDDRLISATVLPSADAKKPAPKQSAPKKPATKK